MWAVTTPARCPSATQWQRCYATRSNLPRFNRVCRCCPMPFRRFFGTSEPSTARTGCSTEDIDLGGHQISADTPIMVYLSAANHDESWCPHAESFDPTRDVPSDHLAFGHGPHKCPGQHMARAVIGVGVEALLTPLHGLRIEELEWERDALLFRGPEKLVLAWDSKVRRTRMSASVSLSQGLEPEREFPAQSHPDNIPLLDRELLLRRLRSHQPGRVVDAPRPRPVRFHAVARAVCRAPA